MKFLEKFLKTAVFAVLIVFMAFGATSAFAEDHPGLHGLGRR